MEQKVEFQSKIWDGLIAAILIIVILAVMIGLIFVARIAGAVGFSVYGIAMILVAGICLKFSLNDNLSEVARAWYGIVGGMAAWTVLELGEMLGFAGIECKDGTHMFILAAIFTWLLWKYFPIGARFFIFIFFLNWGGHIVIKIQEYLGGFLGFFQITLLVYSWAALPLAALIVYWIFTKSETRIQRLYAAGWLYLFTFTFIHMIFFH